MVQLSEESLNLIKDSLNTVADELNETIDEQIQNPEKEQEDKEQKKKDNLIDQSKSDLTTLEKKRFVSISKIFIDEWMKSIEKIKKSQEKKKALVIKKPTKAAQQILKKQEERKLNDDAKKKKEGIPWGKITLIIAGLAAAYFLFKDKIKKILPSIGKALSNFTKWLVKSGGEILGNVWSWLKQGMTDIWEWLKTKLPLEKVTNYITDAWNTFSNWIGGLWNKAKGSFKAIIDAIIGFPKKLINWLVDGFMELLNPVIDVIKKAWNGIVSVFESIWGFIKDSWDNFWKGVNSIWGKISGFFGGIWDWLTEKWKGVIKSIGNLFGFDLAEYMKGKIGKFLIKIFNGVIDFIEGLWGGKKLLQLAGIKRINVPDETVQTTKKTEVKTDIQQTVEKKDIILKDNILETIKDITERLNDFFSSKSEGFITSTNNVIDNINKGFTSIINQIPGIKLNNSYTLSKKDTYKDSYDFSDHSTRSILNDSRQDITNDYSISNNNINLPALDRLIRGIELQQSEEINILTSQNQYLQIMIDNMDEFGTKLSWLDPSKLVQQTTNTIMPMVKQAAPPKQPYSATIVKSVQASLARALA